MTGSTATDRHGTEVATESSHPNLQAGSREHTGNEMSLSKPQSSPPITLIFQQGHTSHSSTNWEPCMQTYKPMVTILI